MNNYILVLDTNVLFVNYDKKPDFFDFSFSPALENIKREVEGLELKNIKIGIPSIVWHESIKQNLEMHDKKLSDFKSNMLKYKLPEVDIYLKEKFDYENYIKEKFELYKKQLLNNNEDIQIFELPIVNRSKFEKIIDRALDKKAPFGGKEKNSDKGFKDVLIWESILQYKRIHKNDTIIFYSKDNIFKDELKEEYNNYFNEEIFIFKTEEELKNHLNTLLTNTKLNPFINKISNYQEKLQNKIINWFNTQEFLCEIQRALTAQVVPDYRYQIVSCNVLDYEFIDFDEYENFKIDCLLDFSITINNDSHYFLPLTQKWTLTISAEEDDLPIMIIESEIGNANETKLWLKGLSKYGDKNE